MNVIAAGAAITGNAPHAAAEATKTAAPEATEAATAAPRRIAGIKCGLAAACAGRRSRPDQPAPIRAFALGVCCGILADLVAQPRHELLDDRTFGRAQSDEHEIRPPAEHRFVAKRCDQLTLAEMAGIVRVAPNRDPAAVDRRLDHLVVMRETQRTCRLQVAELHRLEPRPPVGPRSAGR